MGSEVWFKVPLGFIEVGSFLIRRARMNFTRKTPLRSYIEGWAERNIKHQRSEEFRKFVMYVIVT
jgi:hypothetical protein